MRNPDPARISAPLWWLVEQCTAATSTPFAAEYGGTWARNPDGGSHADAAWLKRTRPNDYSLRGPKQQNGPQDYGRAFDWTFPSAQRGDWSEIGLYSRRVERAWELKDPRMFGVFEVLCQTPEDRQPEGFVFYPEKRFRVPDSSHEWHMHLGLLTMYINDWTAVRALWSVLSGQSLVDWQRQETVAKGVRRTMWVLQLNQPNGKGGTDSSWWKTSTLHCDQLMRWEHVLSHCKLYGQATPYDHQFSDLAEFVAHVGVDVTPDPDGVNIHEGADQ